MHLIKYTLLITALCCASLSIAQPNFSDVESVFNRKGAVQGNIMKLTFPRTDLHVMVGATPVEPGLALTAWLAFEDMGAAGAMLMGDLVLLDAEVPAVEDEIIMQGLEISAIHNHLLGETP